MYDVVVTKSAMNDLAGMSQTVNQVAGKGITKLVAMTDPATSNDVLELRNAPGYYRWKPDQSTMRINDAGCAFRVIFKINGNKLIVVGVFAKQITERAFDKLVEARCF